MEEGKTKSHLSLVVSREISLPHLLSILHRFRRRLLSQTTSQNPAPTDGWTGNPLASILHSCSCNLDDASCTSRTVFEDHSRSATALARGHARGIRLIVFTNSPQIQASPPSTRFLSSCVPPKSCGSWSYIRTQSAPYLMSFKYHPADRRP